jgi:hypothetical protein
MTAQPLWTDLAGLDGPLHCVHTIVGGYSVDIESYGVEVEYYFYFSNVRLQKTKN